MKIDSSIHAGATIFAIDGEVDLETSPQLRNALLEKVNHGTNVIVDMSGVSYIDSSGIASLVEAYQTARRTSAEFYLCAISENAARVLQLARLDKVFKIFETRDDAKAALS